MHVLTAILILLLGSVPTYGGGTPISGAQNDLRPQVGQSDASPGWSVSEVLVQGMKAVGTADGKDCDEPTTTTRVTVRPNRVVRSLSPPLSVQCASPPAPEQATIQENNP